MTNWVLKINGNVLKFDGDELLELAIEEFLEKFSGTEIGEIEVSREGKERPECEACRHGRIDGERWDVQACRECGVLC